MTPEQALLCDWVDGDAGHVSLGSAVGKANWAGADGQVAVANVGCDPVQAPAGQGDVGRTESRSVCAAVDRGGSLPFPGGSGGAGWRGIRSARRRCMRFNAWAVPFGGQDIRSLRNRGSHGKWLVIDAVGTLARWMVQGDSGSDEWILSVRGRVALDTDIPVEATGEHQYDLNEALKRRQPGGAGSSHGAHCPGWRSRNNSTRRLRRGRRWEESPVLGVPPQNPVVRPRLCVRRDSDAAQVRIIGSFTCTRSRPREMLT